VTERARVAVSYAALDPYPEDRMTHRSKSVSPSRREFVVALSAVALSGCFGKFGATDALYQWNKEVSDNKWLRWLVFLLFIILPVYELFMIADALVLNTIEFFSGDNPISGGHVKLEDGRTVHSARTDNPNVIKHEVQRDGKVVGVVFVERVSDDELRLLDAERKPVARARMAADGSILILDGDGKVQRRVTPDERKQIEQSLEAGATPSQAYRATFGDDTRMASLGLR
jgi:hypothetical protein